MIVAHFGHLPRMLCSDVGELVVPVGLAVEGLLLQPCDWVLLRLVVDPEVGGLGQEVVTVETELGLYHTLTTEHRRVRVRPLVDMRRKELA